MIICITANMSKLPYLEDCKRLKFLWCIRIKSEKNWHMGNKRLATPDFDESPIYTLILI